MGIDTPNDATLEIRFKVPKLQVWGFLKTCSKSVRENVLNRDVYACVY